MSPTRGQGLISKCPKSDDSELFQLIKVGCLCQASVGCPRRPAERSLVQVECLVPKFVRLARFSLVNLADLK